MSIRSFSNFVLAATAAVTLIAAQAEPARGQETGRITGLVISAGTNRPIAGAQVFIDGTGIGALTNREGRYLLLNVPAGQYTLQVQIIGYGSAEQVVMVASGQSATANFELTQSAIALDEIVVTGAGQAVQRRRLGNTIATINVAEELATAPVNSVSEVLQGRVPGVTVTQAAGVAGQASRIRVRGSASLTQSNQPVVYIDGVRVIDDVGYGDAGAGSRLDDLNPASIARIEVLKGAAAATLYGTEAANGVIQIFTKRGQSGEPQWTLDIGGGFSTSYDRVKPISGYAVAEQPTPGVDRGTNFLNDYWGIDIEPYEVFSIGVKPYLFETGRNRHISLGVSGGSNFLTYYVNGRYAYQNGYLSNKYGPADDENIQMQLSANLTILPMENLRLRLTTRYTDRYHSIPVNGDDIEGVFGESVSAQPETAWEGNLLGHGSFITIRESSQILVSEEVQHFGGSLSLDYTPVPNVTFEATAGLDFANQLGIEFKRYGWNVDGRSDNNPKGAREVQNRNYRDLTFDVRASWDYPLTSRFTSALVVGAQMLVGNEHATEAENTEFPAPGLEVVGAGAHPEVDESILNTVQAGIFAQETVGFRDYLFFTAGIRMDRHSAFGESTGSALYPKLGISFVASDMPAWPDLGSLSTLRFRGAFGQAGTQPGAFDKFTTFQPIAAETGSGVEPDNLGNQNLRPEVSTELEVGFEAGLFNDRFGLQGTYWNRTVTDLLIARQFAPSGGFTESQLINLGEMKARGLELGVDGLIYNGQDISVNLFANGTYLFQEVTDMGGAPPLGSTFFGTWVKEGYAPGSFFGAKLKAVPYPFDTNQDGQPDTRAEALAYFAVPHDPADIPLAVMDKDGDGNVIDHYLGKPVPDWSGAFGTRITFLSNFTLSSVFGYMAGNFQHNNMMGGWRKTHPQTGRNTPRTAQIESTLLNPGSTPEERLEAAQAWANVGASLAPYNHLNSIEDADFIRWRELSLTYRVPTNLANRMGASALSLTAGARNLMLWTKYSGMDPEANVATDPGGGGFLWGIDAWVPPAPRRFTFSAQVSF